MTPTQLAAVTSELETAIEHLANAAEFLASGNEQHGAVIKLVGETVDAVITVGELRLRVLSLPAEVFDGMVGDGLPSTHR